MSISPPEHSKFKPGQSGNPNGRPKGTSNWSTIVRRLLDDPNLADALVANKPAWWRHLPETKASHAIVAAMVGKAITGDYKAAEWLRKTGFGDKVDLAPDENTPKPILVSFLGHDEISTNEPE